MRGSARAPIEGPLLGTIALSLVWLVPGVGLALSSHAPLGAAVLALGGGGVAGGLLASLGRKLGRAVALIPGVISLGWLAASALSGLVSDVLAGAGGLALLASYAPGTWEEGRRGAPLSAFALPAASVGLALATALVFPPAERLVGVAALLLTASVVAVAFLLRRPGTELVGEPGTS